MGARCQLQGVAQVCVNNPPAAVYYIDGGQVSFQVPSGVSGTTTVQVFNNSAASNTISAAAASVSAGIFPIIVNGHLPIALTDPDDDPVIYTAVEGRADVLCAMDRDFYAPAVVQFCRQMGIEIMDDAALLRRLRSGWTELTCPA